MKDYKCFLEPDNGGSPGYVGGTPPPKGGGGPNDTEETPCNGNGILTQPQQPGFISSDGCSGIPSQPNAADNDERTPCEILGDNSNIAEFQAKLDSLRNRVMPSMTNPPDMHETIVTVRKTSTLSYKVYVKPKTDVPGMTMAEGEVSERDIALIHNHPGDGHNPIFSHADLVSFYADYKHVIAPRKNAYTYYVVNANGTTYALRMNDVTALDAFFCWDGFES